MSNQTEAQNYMEQIKKFIFSSKFIVAIIVIIIGLKYSREIYENVEFFYFKFFPGRKLNRETLREEALTLSKNLIAFTEMRRKYEPEWDWERREESSEDSRKYNAETKSIYFQEYYPDLDKIRKEFLKYGISNDRFNTMYEYPTNILVIEDVARSLVSMANEL